MAPKRTPFDVRFWRFVDKSGPCWLWKGSQGHANGYGSFEGKLAHRVCYELLHGPIAEGLQIRHLCGVRLCVNPEHLALGTAKENAADRDEHGHTMRGERHWKRKLCKERIREIRRRHASGETQTVLAQEFGVDQTNISVIVRRKSWRHVT